MKWCTVHFAVCLLDHYVSTTLQAVLREKLSSGFLTRSDTNLPVQPMKMVRGLKFRLLGVGKLNHLRSKKRALFSCGVTAQLICIFIFAYAESKVSNKYMSRVMRKPTFWFSTWSDTNQAVQLQKMTRDLKFGL